VYRSPFFVDEIAKATTVVHGSVEDFTIVERTINEYKIDTVFHLAAQAIVGTANRNPLSTFEANIKGTWVVLEACRLHPTVMRVVVASSDKAYGEHDTLPYQETFALQGRHPYDVSKSCADLIALAYFTTYQTPVCITRCGNLFGPGDLNFNRIIPGTIRSALAGQRPVIRSDGSPVRDYVYVKDAVAAYLVLAEKMDDPKLHGQAFNFGTGEPVSVLELTRKVLAAAGRPDLEPDVQNTTSGEILRQYLSAERAQTKLGWVPSRKLDERLRETVAWYRERANAT
jgi:CDP-glucose 4,6-dehydratase